MGRIDFQHRPEGPPLIGQPEAEWAPGLRKAKIYEQLLLDIILGVLPPSARLDEQTVAQRYQAGLAGVRDALGRLALEGLVVRRARMGTMVAPLDLAEIRQTFEVRHMLEGRSAALAARNASPADIRAIGAAFQGAEDAIARGDLRTLVAMDQAFHRAVMKATGNAVLARELLSLQNLAARYWIFTLGQRTAEEALADVVLHREVAHAIAEGDEAGAERAMLRTISPAP